MWKIIYGMLLLLALGAQAAKVIYFVGEATINGAPVKLNMSVKAGDKIETGKASSVDIKIGAHSSVRVRENSTLVVESKLSEKKYNELKLTKGFLQAIFKKGTRVDVSSTTATASIRGTIFFTRVNEKGTYFCSCMGKVHYEDKKNKKNQIDIEAKHHGPVIFKPDGTMERAGMEDHNDVQIFDQLFYLNK